MTAEHPLIPFEPVKLRPRHDGWTADRQIHFIKAVAQTGCVEDACRQVGMSTSSAYALRSSLAGDAFRRAWDAALDCSINRIEQAAIDRAINGVPRPIFHKGEQVGEWRHFDERLAMFLMRNRRAGRYGKWMDRLLAPGPSDLAPEEELDDRLSEVEYWCRAQQEESDENDRECGKGEESR